MLSIAIISCPLCYIAGIFLILLRYGDHFMHLRAKTPTIDSDGVGGPFVDVSGENSAPTDAPPEGTTAAKTPLANQPSSFNPGLPLMIASVNSDIPNAPIPEAPPLHGYSINENPSERPNLALVTPSAETARSTVSNDSQILQPSPVLPDAKREEPVSSAPPQQALPDEPKQDEKFDCCGSISNCLPSSLNSRGRTNSCFEGCCESLSEKIRNLINRCRPKKVDSLQKIR